MLCSDKSLNARYIDAGARFVAVGVDALLLAGATTELLRSYKTEPGKNPVALSY